MKKRNKKRVAHISGIIAVLFIAPLIVFAAVYYSGKRTNRFAPGSVDIAVNEGSVTSEMVENDSFEWAKKPEDPPDDNASNDVYYSEKAVKIKDTRKYPGEMLRVVLIPMWYQGDYVCTVFDFGEGPTRSNDNTDSFIYTDGEKVITLNMKSGWNENGWSYHSADGCFYYNGDLDGSDLTSQLLDSVELNAQAYELTENYVFRLDVLADAIQISDSAAESRGW